MTKHTIREIRDTLQQRKDGYNELGSALSQEAQLARAESNSARNYLEGRIASLVAQQLPSLDAPALKTFDAIARDHNHPQTPSLLRDRLVEKTATAKAEQTRLEKEHGTEAEISTRSRAFLKSLSENTVTRGELRRDIDSGNKTLRSADKLNELLEQLGAPQITPETISAYDRPQGFFAAAWRHITDKPYREARPVLDGYAKDGIDLGQTLQTRSTNKAALETAELEQQSINAQFTRTEQAAAARSKAQARQMTDREILNDVRSAVTSMILSDSKIFHAVDAAFPRTLDGEAKAMHVRMELFSTLADNIGKQKVDMDNVSASLDKPLKDLKKGVSNGNGSKRVEFDLEGKAAKLDKHQVVMSQRVQAARDMRETSHSYTATSYNNSNDSTNWLLWYMIMTDSNNHANAASAAPAENSYFRAELMGVSPDNAKDYGIDAKSLSIPADVAADLGYTSGTTSSDFNGLSDSTSSSNSGLGAALGATAFSEFNDISKGMDVGSSNLDLGSLTQDLSSFTSDLSSSSSSSSWSSSSYDSGSSYSSSSYDSGSSSSSSSFD